MIEEGREDRKTVIGKVRFEFWLKDSGWILFYPNRFVYL